MSENYRDELYHHGISDIAAGRKMLEEYGLYKKALRGRQYS